MDSRVYKMMYSSKTSATNDFISKGVIDNDGNYINGTQAVVFTGTKPVLNLLLVQIGTNYYYEIMTTDTVNFVYVDPLGLDQDPPHKFLGWL